VSDPLIAGVRRFNRTVTQGVGALHDRYLARDRSLGQARVLWEIGPDGCEVRALRARLDLDSGYLSRLLRSLERDRLVEITTGPHDNRVRVARLTRRGHAERAVLDERSDSLAHSILDPLSDAQRERLVSSMAEVERLLSASFVRVEPVEPARPDAQQCLDRYFAELDARFDGGFDPAASLPASLDDMRAPGGVFLLATLHAEPVGCGVAKFHGRRPAELKRMWVSPAARGLGVGRRLLAELEVHARASGATRVRLETNRSLTEAIALYRSRGYREVAPFNDEPYAHHWFEKRLAR
jgi:DNA-binding MarR family transcriptional regulator/GNAT superfamily N-acetyltransferase